MILKNEVSTTKEQKSKIVSSLSYEVILEDPDLMNILLVLHLPSLKFCSAS